MSNWQESVASKNIDKMKAALLEVWRSPDRKSVISAINLMELVTINDFSGKEQLVPIVEVLLRSNTLGQHAEFFAIATELLHKGAPMPKEHSSRENFSSISDYLEHLANDAHDLFIALYNDPSIVNLQGDDGKTILHHAAKLGLIMGSNSAALIHDQLFNAPLTDFTIQDEDGNTPVHIAALYCDDRVTCDYVFPNFARTAAKRGFDFSVLNHQGQAVIHIATRNAYEFGASGRRNTVARLLDIAPDININVLSSSGATALYYAINWRRLDEADCLLAAGADPSIFGSPDRDPVNMVQQHIDTQNRYLSLIQASRSNERGVLTDENKAFLTEIYKVNYQREPDSDELAFFADSFLSQMKGNLKNIQTEIETLKSLKQRLQTSIVTKQQESDVGRNEKFTFWGKTAENEVWANVDTASEEHDRAGPGYGF